MEPLLNEPAKERPAGSVFPVTQSVVVFVLAGLEPHVDSGAACGSCHMDEGKGLERVFENQG